MDDEHRTYRERFAPERIEELFALPVRGDEQDWDVELADPDRVEEFLQGYTTLQLSDGERIALMALLIASYDDYRRVRRQRNLEVEQQLRQLICTDFELHKSRVRYWCRHDLTEEEEDWEDPEWVFAVTPLMRTIWDECQQR